MKEHSAKVALLQQENGKNFETNFKKVLLLIKKALTQGANIIITTEFFLTDYFCKNYDSSNFDLAQKVPGQSTLGFQEIAKKHQVVIVCSLFEQDGPLYYNTLAVIDADGTYLGKYRKMHIPDDPGFYEKYYFTPGDLGYKVFETAYGNIGTLICWDQWFPEAARLTAMKGADILIYPTAIATLEVETHQQKTDYLHAWQTIQQSHAVANGCFVASVNRTGNEEGMQFWGNSFVADPLGRMVACGGEKEEIVYADCNWDTIKTVRREWPFFRDRRVDSYNNIIVKWDEGEPGGNKG